MTALAGITAPGRRATARLRFALRAGRTHLIGQLTPHPFHITRPFRLAGDPEGMATLYLQSSSGGLYGDDDLRIEVALEAGAAVHLTTQASTVAPHARGGRARTRTRFDIGPGALLEHCPDPLILFAGARVVADTTVRLGAGARAILTEAVLPHDPEGRGQPFVGWTAETRIEAEDGGALLIDRAEVAGVDWPARTAGRPAMATLILAGAPDPDAAARRVAQALAGPADGPLYAGASVLAGSGLVLARLLAADGATLSAALIAAWAAARVALTGQAPIARRK